MAKVKCYAPDGTEHIKETVDARECVEILGYTMCQKEIPESVEVVEKKEKKVRK